MNPHKWWQRGGQGPPKGSPRGLKSSIHSSSPMEQPGPWAALHTCHLKSLQTCCPLAPGPHPSSQRVPEGGGVQGRQRNSLGVFRGTHGFGTAGSVERSRERGGLSSTPRAPALLKLRLRPKPTVLIKCAQRVSATGALSIMLWDSGGLTPCHQWEIPRDDRIVEVFRDL